MATEVENNVPETKEVKSELEAEKAEEAKQEAGSDSAANAKEAAPPKVLVHKSNFEKDVVYLYQFSRTPLLPSLSPFCLKVESWLRLTGIKYEVSVRKIPRFPRLSHQNRVKLPVFNTSKTCFSYYRHFFDGE